VETTSRPNVSDCWNLYWIAEILVQLKHEGKLDKDEAENLYCDLFAEERKEFFGA